MRLMPYYAKTGRSPPLSVDITHISFVLRKFILYMNCNTDPQITIIIMYAIAILWKVRPETLYSSKAKEVYLELSIQSLG